MKSKPKVTCIVPAYNEAGRIENVLPTLIASPLINEIIVVDDGSNDGTGEIVKKSFPNLKLIKKAKNEGKANAMITGAIKAKNPILFFCDADLTGLTQDHLKKLILPVVCGKLRMAVGAQEYMNTFKTSSGKPMTEFVKTLGGEKVIWKKDFLAIPNLLNSGYGVEQKIIAFFKKENWPFDYFVLNGVGHYHKIKKWGFKGALKEIKAIINFIYQKLFISRKQKPKY